MSIESVGSESLHELVDSAELPGTTRMVDLLGDGSNTDAPGAIAVAPAA